MIHELSKQQYTRVAISLPKELLEMAKIAAHSQDRNLSSFFRVALERELRRLVGKADRNIRECDRKIREYVKDQKYEN
jgi:post-segregation antitoxin (ccd killing protein)